MKDDEARLYYIKRIKKVCEKLDFTTAQKVYYFISRCAEILEERGEKNANKT